MSEAQRQSGILIGHHHLKPSKSMLVEPPFMEEVGFLYEKSISHQKQRPQHCSYTRLLLRLKERNWCPYFHGEGKRVSFTCSELVREKTERQQRREGAAFACSSHWVWPRSHLPARAAQSAELITQILSSAFVVLPPSSRHLVHVCENFLLWRKAANTRDLRSSAWSCSSCPPLAVSRGDWMPQCSNVGKGAQAPFPGTAWLYPFQSGFSARITNGQVPVGVITKQEWGAGLRETPTVL